MPAPRTKSQGARERAASLRDRGERYLRQADLIEEKGLGYDCQTPEEKLARLNSWDSHSRRTGIEARRVGKWMKAPSLYADLVKLLRYIKRRYDDGNDETPVESMMRHLRRGERHVYTLLALLQGRRVRKGRRYLEPVLNADGSPLLYARNGGQHANRYRLHRPTWTLSDVIEEEAAAA